MLKLLILCKNFETTKKLVNKVTSNINELRLIGIANELSEAEKILKANQPDIIFSTDEEIVEFIISKFIYYYPQIVLFTQKRLLNIPYRHLLLLKPNSDLDVIATSVSIFIKDHVDSEKEKAVKTLVDLGFSFKLCGTLYILDSILYIRTYKGSYSFEKVEEDVYSHVARINNTTIKRVKWSVARAINVMYDNHTRKSYQVVEKYFNITFPTRPTPKFVISVIANNLDL